MAFWELELGDLDKRSNQIVVLLKGARDEHRVPIADEFGHCMSDTSEMSVERPWMFNAVWIAARKGNGRTLSYASFELAIRYNGEKCGVRVTPHMFRHTLGQGVLEITAT